MGTSVSQRSPSTANWSIVAATYTSDTIPVSRIVQEVWRAATNQPEGNLVVGLGSSVVADCLHIAQQATSREEATRDARRSVAMSGQASLAADIAQRAVAQSFHREGDRAMAFAESLFSEAGDYLVSRDLSGHVGAGMRAQTIGEAIELKRSIRAEIVQTVGSVAPPSEARPDATTWRTYVNDVVARLTGRG